METITKKQQFINDCKEAMGQDNAGITLFIHMPTGEEEKIHNPNIAAKLAYVEKAYDEDLHLKSCPDISIEEYHIHYPMDEVMDFGVALMNLKEGHRVARKGWNGKGMYVFLATGVNFRTEADLSEFNPTRTEEFNELNAVEVGDMLVLRTAQGTLQPGWLASQADMLAEDWVIL